jgi:transposase-like protein/predicted phosphodiesterase
MAYKHRRQHSDEVIKKAFETYYLGGHETIVDAAQAAGVSASTLGRWIKNPELVALFKPAQSTTVNIVAALAEPKEPIDPDSEIVEQNAKLARKNQALMDSNRIERKSFRESARVYNMVEELTQRLIETFTLRKFHLGTVQHAPKSDGPAPIGVIQLSDLHVNSVIQDVQENTFNLDIASRRIAKHVRQSSGRFKADGVEKVVIALTGDLVKNIQHLSEISSNSISRANCTFVIVDIIAQIVKELNDDGFNVVIASIVGNESRATEHIHETDFLASDSFDLMIHKILQYVLKNEPGVKVLPMENTMEMVLNLNGSNLLMIHGHGHGRSAGTATLEKAFDTLAARYASMGTRIDYMICGHIHQAYISDKFARSGSIMGTDEYAARKLNLWGRASQNSYVFYADGSIDGFKHDLQNVEGWTGYPIDEVAAALTIENRVKPGRMGHNMVISANGVPFAAYTV